MFTVGVLTPHAAAGPEFELPAMAPGGLQVVVERIPVGAAASTRPPAAAAELRALATTSALRGGVAALREASVDAIAYASTTTAYAIGSATEAVLAESLRRMAGVPVATSGLAASHALRACGVNRVALAHPPWFEIEMSALGTAYFREQGIDAVALTPARLPTDPIRVRPEQVIDWISSEVGGSTEAVFIAGSGFRGALAIAELERRTGKLVLEANQLLLWSILAEVGAAPEVDGYGRLFRTTPDLGILAPSAKLIRTDSSDLPATAQPRQH